MKARTRIWLLFLAPPKYAQGWIAELGAWDAETLPGGGQHIRQDTPLALGMGLN